MRSNSTKWERTFQDIQTIKRKIEKEEAEAIPSQNYIVSLNAVLKHKQKQLEKIEARA